MFIPSGNENKKFSDDCHCKSKIQITMYMYIAIIAEI